MSDTPRTEEQVFAWTTQDGSDIVHASFARELERENARLRILLTPSQWDRAQSDAWHMHIPDVHAAFKALRETAEKKPGG